MNLPITTFILADFYISNNVIHCLQNLIFVVNVAFGNYCHQFIKLDSALSGEIIANQCDKSMPR